MTALHNFLGTVLIVEDNEIIKAGAVNLIEDQGYLALSASNADEALVALDAHSEIDVLFTDIAMPGSMDGLALAIETRRRHPGIEIVIASGNAEPETSEMPSGGSFLPKPYNSDQIGIILRRKMAGRLVH